MMNRRLRIFDPKVLFAAIFCLAVVVGSVPAADVITNGNFSSGTTGWTHTDLTGSTTMSSDGSYGNPSPSLGDITGTGRTVPFTWYDYQSITTTINATDSVFLSLWWQKIALASVARSVTDIEIRIVKPGSSEVTIWSETSIPAVAGTPITGTVNQLDVSSFFDENGLYEIRLYANVTTGNNKSGQIQINWDNIVLDAQAVVANDPPVVTDIPNQSVAEGSTFTTINLDDYVSDPQSTDAEMTWSYTGNTELTVDITSRIATITIPDVEWSGAETITFRATDPGLLWDEDPATFTVTAQNDPPVVIDIPNQTIAEGATFTTITLDNYVSDVDNSDAEMTWSYSGNTELTVDITARIATITIPNTDWNGAETITFRATDPGALWDEDPALFTVTAQNDPPVVTDIPNQTIAEGATFTTITLDNYVSDVDNLDADMTWTYSGNTELTVDITSRVATITIPDTDWNGAETITFRATDPGTLWDEDPATFTVTAQNDPPVVVLGATTLGKGQVNRVGSDNTTISTSFTDVDQPGVGAFTCTFKIRDNLSGEYTLVNDQPNGAGGLTITDDGGGSYTASYNYNPDDAQLVDTYDLYFEVSDGIANAIDPYASNDNELEIIDQQPNNAPTIVSDAMAVSPITVNRFGTDSTVLSCDFSDTDDPGAAAFTCTFKVRDNVSTEYTLVNAESNGGGGLTITDNTGGSYTASYTWDPGAGQVLGLYDLYFEVNDGTDNAVDSYTPNTDELTVVQQAPPTVAASATTVSPATVNRFGTDSTVISASFADIDQPAVSAFTCTFKIRDGSLVELTLVNDQPNGSGGLSISNDGGGNYTARYTYDPDGAQAEDLYDLYFQVSDGTTPATDDYAANDNELQIFDLPPNSVPLITAGAPAVSVSPVNRYSTNTTTLSAVFFDGDSPGIAAFNCTFRISDTAGTEYTLVNNEANGGGGLVITDGGGGSYTASYVYNPDDAQVLGLYDLYFEVTDGTDNAIDGYANNADELDINEILPPTPPTVSASATTASPGTVDRLGTDSSVIWANFTDVNLHPVGTFNCTFKLREPDNIAELVLVNNLSHGVGGLTVTDIGGGAYTASYTYDPDDAQTQGDYDLYFEVTDGSTPAVDSFANNSNELQITEVVLNEPPVIIAGATGVNPTALDRFGAGTTQLSITFDDADDPGVNAFFVTFKVLAPQNQDLIVVADALQDGQSGMSITAGGGTSYTATIDWDPPDNAVLGYYDLYAAVSDSYATAIDDYADNLSELQVTNGGENAPPIVQSDAAYATPAGVERIGTNPTTLTATFEDGDGPAVSVFRVSFKVREPDDLTEVVVVDNLAHGAGGLNIADLGGGVYTATVDWDPTDSDTLGYWDLYFHVTDGTADTSFDAYRNNIDEIELYDAISNNSPTLVTDTTFALPVTVNRIGSEYSMLKAVFTDVDMPGKGAFTISFKVMDAGSGEVVVVNAAKHGEQGLRVVHKGAGTYEASVLWDPDVADATGLYDLQFEVSDGIAAVVIDNYATNSNELTVTSSAVLGDGYLLKRNHDSSSCGGAGAACHNLIDHQAQDCLVCHTPHGTTNIYLVRETIQTPSSGPKPVVFKTLGIGDPYNDPDPTPGTWAGAMADSTDNVFTGVCEVCHVDPVGHHRNDGSQPGPNHNDAKDCTSCHPHSEGFGVSGGGESSGGSACSCHSGILATMDSTSSAYRHILADDAADYSPGVLNTYTIKNCLSCHVDHDIFRPDLNTGFGQRARNLRTDWAIDPVQGDASVLSNSDYSSTGSGGICLSCHSGPSCQGCHSSHKSPPRGIHGAAMSDFTHTFIPKADFDAATSAHNYDVPSTFSTDGSTFNANCTKCHSDDKSKSYQSSTYKFSLHGSVYDNILDSTGITGGTDPLEEKFCFKCHSTTSNPNAGSNLDFFGVKSITNPDALDIEAAFSRTYAHPTLTYSGRHVLNDSVLSFADGNRHAECEDCHNPHAAQQGTHDGSSSLVSNALKGTWGVKPTSWPDPSASIPSDNANVFLAPSGYTRVDDATLTEWMICLKCHSNYTTLPSGNRNIAAEINPNYPSTHGIVDPGTNTYCNSTTMLEPWATSGITWCSDCHRSDNSSDPNGPHGSNSEHLLVATMVSNNSVGTPLCYECHQETVYWSDNGSSSRYNQHPSDRGGHAVDKGCFACHMWDYADQAGLGVQTSEVLTDGEIFVHGQNKYWKYKDDDGTAGSGDSVAAFVNGYIANMDYSATSCWSDENNSGCGRSHNGTGY